MSKNKKRKKGNRPTPVRPVKVLPDKLQKWQERLRQSDEYWQPEVVKMERREALYNGDHTLKPLVKGDQKDKKATHVRNIIFENIESQISSSIPQPKIEPWRQADEGRAEILENWIRGELNRQPFEMINDLAERTVPIQGGVFFFLEWDNTRRTHNTVGCIKVTVIHPKQFAPQPGIYTSIEDMDWFILKIPTTKDTIQRRYGIDVHSETESEPEVRTTGNGEYNEEALTQYIGFRRNEEGTIDRYSWVNEIQLEDLENYQARRLPTCKHCGRVRPMPGQVISHNVQPVSDGMMPHGEQDPQAVAGQLMAQQLADSVMAPKDGELFLGGLEMAAGAVPEQHYDGGPCPWCGGEEWEDRLQEYEQVILPIKTEAGVQIPGEHPGFDETGRAAMVPTQIPFYKLNVYPVILQRSVSVFGQLLGNSDVDAIEDQQNTTNRIEKKIIDRLLKAGCRITLPDKASLRTDPEDMERWFISPADKACIGLYEFKGNLQYELMYLSQVYEESRQILGITDSFQGRQDPTATSGKAKEYSAAMAAGRLESKRVMKNAAYAGMFELMFKMHLAYADEPRPVAYKDYKGETVYKKLDRYDFLEQDNTGRWYWNDEFLFACDTAGPLASNREAMWQETRMNLQTGAFGDPAATETLVLFWSKMELLHYPGAGHTKKYLEDKLQREQQQAMQLAMQQAALQQQAAMQQRQMGGMPGAMPQTAPAQQLAGM